MIIRDYTYMMINLEHIIYTIERVKVNLYTGQYDDALICLNYIHPIEFASEISAIKIAHPKELIRIFLNFNNNYLNYFYNMAKAEDKHYFPPMYKIIRSYNLDKINKNLLL